MANKVSATIKQTLHIEGTLYTVGQTITISELHAKELEGKDLLTITGDVSDEATSEKENSFSITDNTGKPKEKAEKETNPVDPIGEKNTKAGPSKTASKKAK
jgi:hypothetical protein